MSESPKVIAQKAFDAVDDDDVAALILRQAEERLRSQHVTSMALDTRITQATALQFAAAAAAGGWAASQHGASLSLGAAALSAVAFLVGAMICFRGVRSDYFSIPGLPPAWWANAANYPDMTLRHAQCWVVGAIQDGLDENARGDEERASSLNLSLRYAVGGAVLVVIATLAKLTS